MDHKKIFIKSVLSGFYFMISVVFFGLVGYKVYGALSTVTPGSPLTAGNWNEMISNFFWGSGSGGIYYNGKVGIGTNAPNRNLHVYDTTNNAEIDIQSVVGAGKHWGIYQNATTQNLHMRNSSDRLIITTGGNLNVGGTVNAGGTLNAAGGLCMNGDCKTAWSQVGGGSSLGVYQFTGTSVTCSSSNGGKVKYSDGKLYVCDGTNWIKLNGGSNIVSYNGARKWEDGTYSKTCFGYRSPVGSYYYLGDTGDGLYWIDPLNSGSPVKVYCDMTTDGGGWTLIGYAGNNSAGFPNLSTTVGTYDGVTRSGKASFSNAVAVTKLSTRFSVGFSISTNFNGNMGAYSDVVAFKIPDPSIVTLIPGANGTCTAVSETKRISPAGSIAKCTGNGLGNGNSATNCGDSASIPAFFDQSLGATRNGFGYGIEDKTRNCTSFSSVRHKVTVDASSWNWTPSATNIYNSIIDGSASVWVK